MMRVQNKETFKSILFIWGMVVCLFLAGCRDTSRDKSKSVDHYNQGLDYYNKGEYEHAIAEFTKAIEINSRDAEAYINRGAAYYLKGEYDKGWEDVHKAQSLGYQVDAEFLKNLHEASGREK